MFVLKNVCKKSKAALHRLTQDVQCSTRYPKTHVGEPDLDYPNLSLQLCSIRKTNFPQEVRQKSTEIYTT